MTARPDPYARRPLREELRDFWHFVRAPSLSPRQHMRMGGRDNLNGWEADWRSGPGFKRLLQWAAVLWAVNLFVLGPVAVGAAGLGGSGHRLDIHNIPWVLGLLWAPLVEELAFRYGLRRPVQALWFVPVVFIAVIMGMQGWTVGLIGLALVVAQWSLRRAKPVANTLWRRLYSHRFSWMFHLSAVGFAAMHLGNFNLGTTPYWLMPALVLPQFFTGLVLGWMRVRRGIGAAIQLHALFNAGPLLMVWLIVTLAPDSVQLP